MSNVAPLACLVALTVATTSCRENDASAAAKAGPPPVIAPEMQANQMTTGPQGLAAARKNSPVHWQHWEPAVLKRATDARRLVFAFVGSAQYPGCLEALEAIDRDPELVSRLNADFLPVLVDIEVARETGIVAGLLSEEIRMPVSFPFLLVLSPEGNEVTWRPIAYSPGSDFKKLFDGATDVIAKMWTEDPQYNLRNSRADHEQRLKRIVFPDTVADVATRDAFLISATRQLMSQYDPDIGTLSGTGGLFPLGSLQCLASSSNDPAIPADLAGRCREAVTAFSKHVLYSPMVDPLDGGVYSSRRGNAWDLPMPQRTCMTQARAARALVSLHASIGEARPLEVALGAVKYAEEQFAMPDGLFSNQRQPTPTVLRDGLWTREQIDAALSPQEAALWKALCGVQDLGNLASEADPQREFFRLNSLGMRVSLTEAAAKAKLDAAQAPGLFESGRKKLLAARLTRLPQPPPAAAGAASPSFRMVSAYAALFTATGEVAWRDKALALAQRACETFSKDNLLVEQAPPVPASVADARAFTYALAIQAALDLAEITLDDTWRLWAGDLATVVAEQFRSDDGRLIEARPASTPIKLPIADRIMLFDDSTAGLMRMNAARLEALGQPPPPEMAKLARSLPPAGIQPVVVTDSILAISFGRSRAIVELPADPSPEWREAAAKLPLDRIARRIGKESAVKIRRPDGTTATAATPAELAAAVGGPKP
ncbi:DUF255 domain-containing protein [Luteolibacter arcticus]|uniref:DUF255 domain-containing protein n=1 Tax=Luteolibacter arcticus TaxID=1581411 RepID=A0ABT3GSH4_9BACT|nr:DUF255 domain-containing protein [Luteolibacter arcticus]MCW1926420.1 DUF255 domain-containing protein [Luteolibacter arcticus]